uniref:Uncharacterized protein n=1 Tax=Anguilla anguilla TaxID=7936 RepID=A0A0E9WA78_ANGAN
METFSFTPLISVKRCSKICGICRNKCVNLNVQEFQNKFKKTVCTY